MRKRRTILEALFGASRFDNLKLDHLHNIIHQLHQKVDRIMVTQAEQAQTLREVLASLQKTATEIAGLQGSVDTLNQRIVDLEAVIAEGGEASQELVDAVAAVSAQAKVVDDAIPDAPAVP